MKMRLHWILETQRVEIEQPLISFNIIEANEIEENAREKARLESAMERCGMR